MSAVILDVDGTLAPIVARPELAAVPETTRCVIARLTEAFRLVACVSGRAGAEAEALVGVEGVRYVGNHGLELHPDARAAQTEIAAFRDAIADVWPVEDKGLSLSLHFRESASEAEARGTLDQLASEAEARGLDARWGRKVLEIRPRLSADKGTAVSQLLRESGARRALYAGDDTTDLDAFDALAGADLDVAVRIAVDSPEAPPGLIAAADVVARDPAELAGALGQLSGD